MKKRVLLWAMICFVVFFTYSFCLAAEEGVAGGPKIVDKLILQGASYLDNNADWTNETRGREVYDSLRRMNGNVVTEALVRAVLRGTNRLHVLFLGVKLGIEGSQEKLIQVLMDYGDKEMAEDFLNSGSSELFEGGKRWANAHGYYISTGMGSHRIGWGRF